MQYVQVPYTEWVKPFSYNKFYSNGVQHNHHLSSNASSRTDGSSVYDSVTSYQYDDKSSGIGRTSLEMPYSICEVFIKIYF